jgi:pimeloyl-ACP methyl ester carboxylesterase
VRSHVLAERVLAVCDILPRGSMPPDFSDPVKSDVPTLILSGALDPVTPPQYGVEVAKTLANSKHVVAAGYGHVVSPHACAPRLIAAFIDEAGFKTLPKSCLDYFATSARPPFFTSLLEASP